MHLQRAEADEAVVCACASALAARHSAAAPLTRLGAPTAASCAAVDVHCSRIVPAWHMIFVWCLVSISACVACLLLSLSVVRLLRMLVTSFADYSAGGFFCHMIALPLLRCSRAVDVTRLLR